MLDIHYRVYKFELANSPSGKVITYSWFKNMKHRKVKNIQNKKNQTMFRAQNQINTVQVVQYVGP